MSIDIVDISDEDGTENCEVISVGPSPSVASKREAQRPRALSTGCRSRSHRPTSQLSRSSVQQASQLGQNLRFQLGVPPPAARYFVERMRGQARRALAVSGRVCAISCTHCRLLIEDGEICLGFMRPGHRRPYWCHAARDCLGGTMLPRLPSSMILFSPLIRHAERQAVLGSLGVAASEATLRSLASWRYVLAASECWSRHGGSRPRRSELLESSPLVLTPNVDAVDAGTGVLGGVDVSFEADSSVGISYSLATQAVIDALPPPRLLAPGDSEQGYCAICHEKFSKEKQLLRSLPCCHIFHDECILPWLRTKSVCPLDRIDLAEALGIS